MGRIQDKEKTAELLGAFLGDGWIESRETSAYLAGDMQDDKQYYDLHISELITSLIAPTTPKEYKYWRVYGVGFHKKKIIQMLLSWGIPKGKKSNTAKIPRWVSNSRTQVKKACIRGLFDTDGNISFQKVYGKYKTPFNSKYHCKPRIRFTTISQQLCKDILAILYTLHFSPVTRKRPKGYFNNRNRSETHIIELNKLEEIQRFFTTIRPANHKHTTKYAIWKQFGFYPPKITDKQRRDILKNRLDPYSLY